MKTIYIFTMNGCPYCETLKNSLVQFEIPFKELEISENKNLWNQVIKQTKLSNLPTVFIRDEESDYGPVYIPGRDYETNDEIIKIIKQYI